MSRILNDFLEVKKTIRANVGLKKCLSKQIFELRGRPRTPGTPRQGEGKFPENIKRAYMKRKMLDLT